MNNLRTALRVSTPILLVALGVCTTGEVSAADAPKLSTLTVGRMTTVPAKKEPATIGARESVPGFYLAAPPWPATLPARHRSVSVVSDPKTAETIKSNRHIGRRVEETNGACFSESHFAHLPTQTGDESDQQQRFLEWGTHSSFSKQAQVQPKSKDNPSSGVTAVHSERFVEQNGSASLETVDVWVDPDTRGVRLIGKSSLPLSLVNTLVGGVRVFAGRDERPDGKRFVQFVLQSPKEKDRTFGTGGMWATRSDGEVIHGACDHLRVGIRADVPGGEHAIFTAQVLLPPSDADGAVPEPSKTPKSEPPAGSGKAKDTGIVGEAEDAEATPKEIRTRALEVQVSVSQTTRDKEPVISVSFGWATREVRMADPRGLRF